jgi:hypothetical protein
VVGLGLLHPLGRTLSLGREAGRPVVAVAILIASRSISRGLAFAIFVGSTSLHGRLAVAFTSGLHAAFYASMGFMALAAALSALRAGSSRV